jgi:hypothetical protein
MRMSKSAFLFVALLGAAGLVASAQLGNGAVVALLLVAAVGLALEVIQLRRKAQGSVGDVVRAAGGIVLLGMIVCAGGASLGILRWFMQLQNTVGRRITCLANVKAITSALEVYISDNDQTPPPMATWCDAIKPAIGERQLLCPSAAAPRGGYAYNTALGRKAYGAAGNRAFLILLLESDRGWNAAGGPELLPDTPRHLGGDNLSFVDGHAMWVRRENVVPGNATSGWRKGYPEGATQWKP